MLQFTPLLLLLACTFTEGDGANVKLAGLGAQSKTEGLGGAYITDTRVFGLWVETAGQDGKPSGGGLGYRRRKVALVPFDCKAVFVVKTDAQLMQVADLIEKLKTEGEDLCATKD